MRKKITSYFVFFIVLSVCPFLAIGQPTTVCPNNAGVDQTLCAPNCATLTGTFVNVYATNTYAISTIPYAPDPYNVGTSVFLQDDQWSQIINLPFSFCFYGNNYTTCMIGSNGMLSFSVNGAGGYCQWPIGAPVPTNQNPMNTVMGPWQDLYPPAGGTIKYTTYGTTPCRRFVVSWYQLPMYACTSTLCTQQITIYETTNIIDNFIQTKPTCGWNSGRAIEAIHNINGTAAMVVAGRNSPTIWTTTNDGKRYSPTGTSTCTLAWYQGVNLLSSSASVVVCPTTTTTYTFQAIYTNCNNVPVTLSDQVVVNVNSLPTTAGPDQNICIGACVNLTGVAAGATSFAWTTLPGNTNVGNTATINVCPVTTTTYVVTSVGPTCTGADTVTINVTAAIILSASQTNINCFGQCIGSATVVATGGNGTFTYLWTPSGGTAATASNLCAGTYTCTVTSGPANCTATQTFTITQPLAFTATQTQVNILCSNACTGTATVIPSGGVGPYSYLWSPSGGTNASATLLCAGTYTCTITDANNCVLTKIFTFINPIIITATQSQINLMCNAICNGSATVVAAGGTGIYTYSWSPSGGNNATATNLCAGNYTCTITDSNGCSRTQSFIITQPPALTATQSQINLICNAVCNGSASVVVSGGTGPYTYAWTPSGGNAAAASNLCAGNYTCIITDANNCALIKTFIITQPPALTATQTQINITCNSNCNGSATAIVSGGTGPYTYTWAPSGGNTATASSLCAGTYTCTITDANSCSITQSFNITQPNTLVATQSQINLTCNAVCSGSATVVATGGTGVYTYAWAPSGGNAATASNLCAGTYTCTITDANNCFTTQSFIITQPPVLTATQLHINLICNSICNGIATVFASGGTGIYTYAWSPSGGNAATASNLCMGTYTCTITDANNCSITQSFNITQPPVLTATQSHVNLICNSICNGTATVFASGGTGIYTYAWLPSGGNAATAANLCAGTYTCTITDANNCSLTQSFNITQPPALTATQSQVNLLCNAVCIGTATVVVSGGTGIYNYTWTPSGGNAATAINLCIGTYTCTITDANNCSLTQTFNITQPSSLTATQSQLNVTCNSVCNASATVNASGGTGVYTYLWAPSGGNTANATNLCSGTYTCTITDASNCSITQSFNITQPSVLTAAQTQVNLICNAICNGSATVAAIGGTGVYTYNWMPSGGNNATAINLCAGTYTCTITDANSCSITQSFNITQPSVLTATQSQVDLLCNSICNGSASVIASGGTGVYSYTWAPSGGNTATATNLCVGTYTCTITDANNCTITQSFNITQPPALTATATQVNVTCNALCNASATVLAIGGTGICSYAWSPAGGNTATASNLCAGNYTCTITDANNCFITQPFIITQPTLLTITASALPSFSCTGDTVQLSANAVGGTPNLNVVWMPGTLIGSSQNIIPTTSSTYTATVTDANGCIASTTISVSVYPTPTPQLTASVTSGCSPVCVNFSDSSFIAPPSIINSWFWDFGDGNTSTLQNPSHCYNTAGIYTVYLEVKSANGCINSVTFTNYINVFQIPVADFTASPQPTTILEPTIYFTDNSAGAAFWSWSFGDLNNSTATIQNPSFLYPIENCYDVTLSVQSINGCTDSASMEVCIRPDAILYLPNAFTPNQDGLNELFLPSYIGIDPDRFEMWIFDRWGNLIYFTDDLLRGWDGRVQGKPEICPIGTYVWKINCRGLQDQYFQKIGRVSLIK
ncbi:MAG: hypothetical protein CK539_03130 [Flavobacteriales bacterium]|nr:MAG: hypothetical protein CK539_03130 [Flavobacteriales bacterium]